MESTEILLMVPLTKGNGKMTYLQILELWSGLTERNFMEFLRMAEL